MMHSGEPMAEALREELAPLAKSLKKTLRKAKRGKKKAVHDARTLLRRLREGLNVMGRTACDRERASALADSLRKVERALGPARDDAVLLQDFREWLSRGSPAQGTPGPGLVEWLEGARSRHLKSLGQKVRRRRMKRLLRRLIGWLDDCARHEPDPVRKSGRSAPSLVRHFVPEEAWHAYDRILAFDRRPLTGFDVMHKVRSACRRLRYVLELFRGALPPDATPIIASLQTVQDRLGDLHDHAVAVDRIEGALHSGDVPDSPTLQLYLAHRRSARDDLAGKFHDEWRRLTGEAFRFALSHLVSGERAPGRIATVPKRRHRGIGQREVAVRPQNPGTMASDALASGKAAPVSGVLKLPPASRTIG